MDEYKFAPEAAAVLVAAFDEANGAADALKLLKTKAAEGKIKIKVAGVISRDEQDKLHIHETGDLSGKRRGLLGWLGLLDTGIANDKLEEIGRVLGAGSSVLVVTMPLGAEDAVRQELQAAGAEVISQELSPRVVAELESRLQGGEAGGV
jgi:uncharacterized membrane protein